MRPRIYARSLLLTVLGVLVASTSSLAGTMSFSVYDDASVSNNRLVAYTTVHDNSSGCTHGSYSTKVTIYSPSQRSATSTASGLQANVSLAISGETGNYTVVTDCSYSCSCFNYQIVHYGSGQDYDLQVYYGRYKRKSGDLPHAGCDAPAIRFNAEQCSHACMYAYICNVIESPYKETQGYRIVSPYYSTCIQTSQVSRPNFGETACTIN